MGGIGSKGGHSKRKRVASGSLFIAVEELAGSHGQPPGVRSGRRWQSPHGSGLALGSELISGRGKPKSELVLVRGTESPELKLVWVRGHSELKLVRSIESR